MSNLILAGATLVAGQGQGQLNEYYGLADTTVTTVTAATATTLSTVYTIPAGEAYAGAGYELSCGGSGVWGSTPQQLSLVQALNGTSFGSAGSGHVAAAALAASAGFFWTARMTLVCVDGVSSWECRMEALVIQAANAVNPGTASTNAVPVNAVLNHTASVSSAITVALQASWGSTTGAPTLTNNMTTWKKIA